MIRLLIMIFALIVPLKIVACSCGNFWGPVTIKDYNENEIIISGRAVKVTVDLKEPVDKQRQIDFEVDELFKGDVPQKKLKIFTADGDGPCGLYVNEKEDWVIWAYMINGVITTNLCTRSLRKEKIAAQDLTRLRYFATNPETKEWVDDKGVKTAEGRLEGNKPVGYWRYYYSTGFPESEGVYQNGKQHGRWTLFFDPYKIIMNKKENKINAKDSTYGIEPFKCRIREIQNYKVGVRDGEFVYYSGPDIDKPKTVTNYKNGMLEGKSIAYYSNGLINYEQNYKAGKLEGYERFYYSNGQLKQTGQFVNSKPVGEFKVFNENGELLKTSIDRRPE